MALPNDSVAITPGSGTTIATHLTNGKEYQVMMMADSDGQIIGSRPDYLVYYPPVANSVNREVAELFNAQAGVACRIRGVWIIPSQTAVTGATQDFALNKISAVGTTGSTVVTPRGQDSAAAAVPAGITARYGSTAGATLAWEWFRAYLFNEETAAPVGLIAYQNQLPVLGDRISEIVLRTGEGFQVKQMAGTVGLTGALIQFAVDN